ncbi:DNA primase, catalytic core [Treponema sp. JC4]|uniref:DNA primase n=1 Tax=Treponema sp. JC4 TaxID=1124982 RepID=UPI00025B0AF5|nr:DNA primase [Treponema sp. JC4]EID84201.1 DNA primase, catalytic core [Treponema sp. JC4]
MAGRISKETVDAINSQADIVSIVGEYTKLERRGPNDWWGCCPIHGEKTPSFHVDGNNHFFNCFGCHKGGTVISFLMEMEKTSFYDTVIGLAKRTGIEVRYEDGGAAPKDFVPDNTVNELLELYDRTATMFSYFLLETEQGKQALKYALDRGLSREIIEKFKLGFAPADRRWLKGFLKSKNYSDEFLAKSGLFSKNYPDITIFSNRLMFPIFNRKGQVVAFSGRAMPPDDKERKYINSPELPTYKKRDTLFYFNFAKNAIRQENKVIVCEGNMDCIAYHQSGLEYAVAPLGTAFTEEQVKILQGFADTILLSFDSDEAGQAATKKAILMCRRSGLTVKVIQLRGGKDPSEILNKFGKENLTAQVNGAILDSDYFLVRLGEKYPVDTPEGKTKAALEYFEYIDSLQSDIQKESCLDQLSQAYNLKPEAVKRDFNNRSQAKERANFRQEINTKPQNLAIKPDAELRGLVAVIADLNQFMVLRQELTPNDFKNPSAQKLFQVLEECSSQNSLEINSILTKCSDEGLVNFITASLSSPLYKSVDVSIIVQDTIKLVKKNKLNDQREKLMQRIRNFQIITDDDRKQLNNLLAQKLELDRQVQKLQK